MEIAAKLILLLLLSFALTAFSTYVAMKRRVLGAFVVLTGALGIALLFIHY